MRTKPEEWRVIPSFPLYEASTWGGIRSRHRVLRQPLDDDGYRTVTVYRDGKAFTRRSHALICEAFHGPKPAWAAVAAHNNGKKLSNWPSNIRWTTVLDNNRDMTRHGTQIRGERHDWSTLTEMQVSIIRAQYGHKPESATLKRLAAAFGVDIATIRAIVQRKTWKHVRQKFRPRKKPDVAATN
jgi:hypothetical protein